MGEVRVPGGPIDRRRQQSRADVGFRKGQRRAVRKKDVGVKEVQRIDHDRPCHPCHIPNRELPVSVIDPADMGHLQGKRVRDDNGQKRTSRQHGKQLSPASVQNLVNRTIVHLHGAFCDAGIRDSTTALIARRRLFGVGAVVTSDTGSSQRIATPKVWPPGALPIFPRRLTA